MKIVLRFRTFCAGQPRRDMSVALVIESDTISAISTPLGGGGISVIRVSGPSAIEIAARGFRGRADLALVPSQTAHFGTFLNAAGTPIDDVVVLLFKGPHSYTGEDVVEVSCHGGMLVTREVLEATIAYGARPAEPGEFTKRAFLNGRMDLTQAEAVADLIYARSEKAHRASLCQLRGDLSEKINAIRDRLTDAIGLLELELDFVDEGYEFADKSALVGQVNEIVGQIDELISSYQIGRVYRDGVRVVIAGAPNVGKSSLLNALLSHDRAIVTDIPGTTRDTIEESLTIGGLLFTVTDTAGLRETTDLVEIEGVRRTEEQLSNCDLVILVLDCSQGITEREGTHIGRLINDHKMSRETCIAAINKIDLKRADEAGLSAAGSLTKGLRTVNISAKTGEGLGELKDAIVDTVLKGKHISSEGCVTITNSRHYATLLNAKESLELSLQSLAAKESGEFIVLDLRAALDALGTITGVVTTDDILDSIFSRFCVGK